MRQMPPCQLSSCRCTKPSNGGRGLPRQSCARGRPRAVRRRDRRDELRSRRRRCSVVGDLMLRRLPVLLAILFALSACRPAGISGLRSIRRTSRRRATSEQPSRAPARIAMRRTCLRGKAEYNTRVESQRVVSRARGLAGRRLPCTEKIAGSNPAGSTLQRKFQTCACDIRFGF
jgi:hypothetical protein